MTSPLPVALLTAASLAVLPEPLAYAHLARIPAQVLHGMADGLHVHAAAAHSHDKIQKQPHGQMQPGPAPSSEPDMKDDTVRHAAMPPVFIEMRPAQRFMAAEPSAESETPAEVPQQPGGSSIAAATARVAMQAGEDHPRSRWGGYSQCSASEMVNDGGSHCPSVDLDSLPAAAQLKATASLASRLRAETSRMAGGDAAADKALLAKQPGRPPDLSSTARMALGYRAGQKAIAAAALDALTARLGGLLHQASRAWAAVVATSGLPAVQPFCRHHLPPVGHPNTDATHQHDVCSAPQDGSHLDNPAAICQAGATAVAAQTAGHAESVRDMTSGALAMRAVPAETARADTGDVQTAPAGLAATLGGGVEVMSALWGMRVNGNLMPRDLLVRVESNEMLCSSGAGDMLDQLISACLSVLQGLALSLLGNIKM